MNFAIRVSFSLPACFWLQFTMSIRRFQSQSTMRTFTIHSTIHSHLQSALPSPSSCAGSLPQRSHTALALGPHGHIEQQAERQSSHPEGKGTIVDCDTTNRRGVGGVWHTVFRMSRVIAKPQHLTLTVNCICGCFL